jgi:hypothetical protein
MAFDKLLWQRTGKGGNGRAKAGPYLIIRPAEAGSSLRTDQIWSRPLLLPHNFVNHHQLAHGASTRFIPQQANTSYMLLRYLMAYLLSSVIDNIFQALLYLIGDQLHRMCNLC